MFQEWTWLEWEENEEKTDTQSENLGLRVVHSWMKKPQYLGNSECCIPCSWTRRWSCCIQVNKEAGFMACNWTKETGSTNLCRRREAVFIYKLLWGVGVSYGRHLLHTVATITLRALEGFADPLSLTLGRRLCLCTGLGLWSLTRPCQCQKYTQASLTQKFLCTPQIRAHDLETHSFWGNIHCSSLAKSWAVSQALAKGKPLKHSLVVGTTMAPNSSTRQNKPLSQMGFTFRGWNIQKPDSSGFWWDCSSHSNEMQKVSKCLPLWIRGLLASQTSRQDGSLEIVLLLVEQDVELLVPGCVPPCYLIGW